MTKVEPWGLKSLAFRIKKNRKAHFTLMNIAAPSAAVTEVERLLSINEDVVRYLTIRVDEHEAARRRCCANARTVTAMTADPVDRAVTEEIG